MIEILLLSILALALASYVGLWFWTRESRRASKEINAGLLALHWQAEQRQAEHRRFNEQYLNSLTDEDREEFLRNWKGE